MKLHSRISHRSLGVVVALGCLAPQIVFADDAQFGGLSGAGMAGAGLALPVYVSRNNLMNPALLGFARHDFTLNWPGFGYHTDGIDVSQIHDLLGGLGIGSLSSNSIQTLGAQDLNGVKEVGLDASLGMVLNGFALNAIGEANVTTIPNSSLQTWARNGASLTNQTDVGFLENGQLDAYGLAYTQESLGYGDILKTKDAGGVDRIAVGATGKVIQAYYAHKIVSGYTVNGTSVANSSADGADITGMGASGDKQLKGFGLDLGAIYNSSKMKDLYYGLVVENAVEPNIKFDRQLPGNPDAPGAIVSDDINIFRRAVDAGIGWVANAKTQVAMDYIDIGNNASRQELRTGADYTIGSGFSVRAGISTFSGVDFGVSFRGFAIAYSPRTMLTVGTSYKF